MIRINTAIHNKAKKEHLNISEISEKALNTKIQKVDKNEIDNSQVMFKCHLCHEVVEYGYFCSFTHNIWCRACETSNKYCIAAKLGEQEKDGSYYHEHIRVPNLQGELKKEVYMKISRQQYLLDNKEMEEEEENSSSNKEIHEELMKEAKGSK